MQKMSAWGINQNMEKFALQVLSDEAVSFLFVFISDDRQHEEFLLMVSAVTQLTKKALHFAFKDILSS